MMIYHIWHNVPDFSTLALMKEMVLMLDLDFRPATGLGPTLVWTRAFSQNSNNNCHGLIYDTLIPYNGLTPNHFIKTCLMDKRNSHQ